MRYLTPSEEELLMPLSLLSGVETGLFEVTQTQLDKSIIDANASIRQSFSYTGFHEFSDQRQGRDALVRRDVSFFSSTGLVPTTISLYRPNTKNGDPRVWISRLGLISPETKSGDIVAIAQNGQLCVAVNVTALVRSNRSLSSLVKFFPEDPDEPATLIAEELLAKLRLLASRGPILTTKRGDTAVGFAIESALGIEANSRTAPDYEGIEIKSGRSLEGNKNKTLFAKVPDWGRSPVGGYSELVERYGYVQEGKDTKRLYCSVDGRKPNSQGLILKVNYELGSLEEYYSAVPEKLALTWDLEVLRLTLEAKHKETFWIEAEEVKTRGGTGFVLTQVLHTSRPRLSAFSLLLSNGSVWVDHAARLKPTGGNRNHGMLFRTKAKHLTELFSVEGRYSF